MVNRRQIEAREVEQLYPRWIAQHRAQVGRGIRAARSETDEMFVAAPVGDLNEAQPIARGNQP